MYAGFEIRKVFTILSNVLLYLQAALDTTFWLNQCHRKVILSYFEEKVDNVEVFGECCDVCSCNTVVELADYTKEMEMMVKATDVLSGYGEKV